MKKCTFEGCNRKYEARDLCKAHYEMMRKGQILRPIRGIRLNKPLKLAKIKTKRTQNIKTLCSVAYCTADARTKDMCNKHYVRMKKHGDPHMVLPKANMHTKTTHKIIDMFKEDIKFTYEEQEVMQQLYLHHNDDQ